MADAAELHQRAILIDGLNICAWDRGIFEEYRRGGVTAVSCTAAVWENFRDGMMNVAQWLRWYDEHADIIMPVHSVADIHAAKRLDKTGIILNWQNTSCLEDRLEFVRVFKALGVGVMQLTYNTQTLAGAGYLEANDSGLTGWGRELIDEMAAAGVVCDLSHVGDKTSADVIAYSRKPVAFTHVLPRGLKDTRRNKSDELMKAVAEKGGLVGLSLFAPGMKNGNESTVADYIEAIDYVTALVGEDHVAIGTDFSLGHPRPGPFLEWCNKDKGTARKLTEFGSAPVKKPKGIARIEEFPNLTRELVEAGYSQERILKLYGGNWLKLLGTVWGGEDGTMNRRERLAAAIAGKPVDRVPVSAWGHFFLDEVGRDSFVDRMVGFRDAWDWDVLKVHARASYHTEPFGWTYEASTSAARGHVCTHSPVKTPEDWLKLRPAPLDADAFVEQLAALEAIRRRTPADVPVIMTVFTPLDVADKVLDRHADVLARHIAEAPEAVAYGLSVFAATLEPFVRKVAAIADGIFFSTKWVNGAKLSPSAYKRLALASDLHMMAPAAKLPFNLLHVCENEVFLDGFADYPVAMMHWDNNGAHNPSLRAGHVMTGRAVGGGVDAATLATGTAADVTAKAVAAVTGMGGTGMLLGPGCSLRTASTPDANLRALRDAPAEAAHRLATDKAA